LKNRCLGSYSFNFTCFRVKAFDKYFVVSSLEFLLPILPSLQCRSQRAHAKIATTGWGYQDSDFKYDKEKRGAKLSRSIGR
jgi:hypothetical protein